MNLLQIPIIDEFWVPAQDPASHSRTQDFAIQMGFGGFLLLLTLLAGYVRPVLELCARAIVLSGHRKAIDCGYNSGLAVCTGRRRHLSLWLNGQVEFKQGYRQLANVVCAQADKV
jgi:hypothetical protein